jgi:transposase-like protein
VYLYRGVDNAGQTVDFFLSRNRDVNAAKSLLRSAMKNTLVPTNYHFGRLCSLASSARDQRRPRTCGSH